MVAYSKIVIAGGGVVGNSISYYLAKRHGISCTIIDPGKLQWNDWLSLVRISISISK